MKKNILAVVGLVIAAPLLAQKPIAAWNVVPFQRVDGVFNAGVVALHEKDLRVEFSINGKVFFKTSKAVENPRTGVKEYVVAFPAEKLSKRLGDREFKLGAKVFVEGDTQAYALQDISLYSNGNHSLGSQKIVWADSKNGNEFAEGTKSAPVMSLAQAVKKAGDGGTVFLKPGSYSLKMLGGGVNRKFWTKVTLAPGTDRSEVKLFAGRTGTEKLYFKDLDFFADIDVGDYGAIVLGESGKTMAWFENCNFTNLKGRHAGQSYPFGNKLLAYVIGGATYDMASGPTAVLLRAHTVKTVASMAIPGSDSLVVNCVVNGVEPGSDSYSNDFLSARAIAPSWAENLIVYGLKASNISCRAFSIQRLRNSAIADVTFEGFNADETASVFDGEVESVFIHNLSMSPQGVKCVAPKKGVGGFSPKGVLIKGSSFGVLENFPLTDGTKGIELRDCSYRAVQK